MKIMSRKNSERAQRLTFFLGGIDAEMLEIRNILNGYECKCHDKNLAWGAKASQYTKELNEIGTEVPVLVELDVDIDLPKNSIIIDHHNDRAGKEQPTSIEQVADLLGAKLNRWQKLIAANDRGWIIGMREAGATDEEIKRIRNYDRECHGVTEEMENEAEKICSRIRRTKSPVIIDFKFDIISPVTDRLYDIADNLLVLGPNSTTFSGDGKIVQRLAEYFPNSFYGGELPLRGYWGLPYREDKTQKLVKKLWEELYDKKGFSQV